MANENKNSSELKVLNVLDRQYYENCHIPGSLSVPVNELEQFAQKFPKNQLIVVYCAHYECPKSREAWKYLDHLGFTNVHAYEGGVVEWHQKDFALEGSCSLFQDFFKNPPQKPAQSDESIKTISAEKLRQLMEEHKLL